ncbi:flagellar hook-associated protein FlgL [Pseudoalteromonas sp. SSDWG2]|uniref:flagellar hook-associated protein FlgL n=1 Tax=Pseudoalteromonas sp. SSDWG2 TaxID=3139391 RepID=UPI003BACFBEA
MRLSNNQIFQKGLNSILESQSKVSRAQEQINSQRKVLTASDDPSAITRAILYGDAIETNEQLTKNLNLLTSRLETEESVLSNIKDSIQRAHTLTIQAGDGALSEQDREGLAQELKALQANILDLMNAKSEDGKFIFSGYQDNNQTYQFDSATGRYVYGGDQGQHAVTVAQGVSIKSSDNGFDVFEKVPARLNITSNTATTAGGVTAATAYIKEQNAFNQFHQQFYNSDPAAPATANTMTVDIAAGAPATYQVLQDGVPVVPAITGTYTPGQPIKLGGMEIKLQGAVPGQVSFDLARPERENVLNTLEDLIAGVTTKGLSDDDYQQVLADGLVQLSNALNQVSLTQAGLGGRLNTAQRIQISNADVDINNKSARADLVEVDMAEAVTELTRQETALQASQATFNRLSNLSLFDYLR